jgi:hypothetical protein
MRRAEADGDSRLVHHVEHAAQALAAAVPTSSRSPRSRRAPGNLPLAEVEQRVRDAAVAELVLRPASATSLRSPVSAPSGPTSFFGTMKSEMPRVPGTGLPVVVGDLGENQVDDVLGDLVLAVRDPHLVAARRR